MKKILIFEDEWSTIRGSFELANIYAFEEGLQFNVRSKSQDVKFSSWKDEYAAVFIDITLAKNTKMDGYHIVQKIMNERLIDASKIVILTGNSKVQEKLKEMGINTSSIHIMYKPISFDKLSEKLCEIIGKESL